MIDFKEKYGNSNNLLPSPYDKRDYKFKDLIPLSVMKIPDEYETERTPFIFDQGSSSMCCAASYCTIRYLQEKEQSYIDEAFSPAFQYANRLEGENFEGMYVRSCCKKGLEGSVFYSELPGFYKFATCKRLFEKKKDELLEKASHFPISSYYQCSNRESVQVAIMTTKAVLGGIYIYESMYEPDSDGFVHYNKNKDTKNYGGHAVVICGWKTDENGKFWWRIQNSWGKDWGDKGRGWIPEEYPWTESPWALIDNDIQITFQEYQQKYNLTTKAVAAAKKKKVASSRSTKKESVEKQK